MDIKGIDHLVITTADWEACLRFYSDVLGLRHECVNGHHTFFFGNNKLNVHTRPGEFQPAEAQPTLGSQDFCLIADGDIEDIRQGINNEGWPIEAGPVERHGARGIMDSLYVRDPDGNLIEIAVYRPEGYSQ